nr:MAG TPA: hypothetical protein [Caudoviricetes sp.]
MVKVRSPVVSGWSINALILTCCFVLSLLFFICGSQNTGTSL